MKVPAFLSTIPTQAYVVGACVVLAIGGVTAYNAHQRSLGALKFQLAQADSIHQVAVKAAQDSVRVAQHAAKEAASARQAAETQVVRARALQRRTDSVAKEASNAREDATRTLADSLASVATLRQQLGALVTQSRADSAASAEQHTADQRAIVSLRSALTADSVALGRSTAAINALTLRATTAEAQARLTRKLIPSSVGGWLKTAAFVAVAVEIGRASAGKLP